MFVTTSTWQLAKKHIEALLCAQSMEKGAPKDSQGYTTTNTRTLQCE